MPESQATDLLGQAARADTVEGAKKGAKEGPNPRRAPVLIDTAHGPARVHLFLADAGTFPADAGTGTHARGLLMLGHGAGGGVQAPDLRTTTAVANDLGWHVALVEQPYRVAGRRAPAPARQLDAAWTQVATRLGTDLATGASARSGDPARPGEGDLTGLPLAVGGRSSGARVACRTATGTGAIAVLCLAFPLQPPKDRPSRLPELDDVGVPVLVVQGDKDRFGMPPAAPDRTVAVVPGDHSLKKDQQAVGAAVRDWLSRLSPVSQLSPSAPSGSSASSGPSSPSGPGR